ncbi:MAG TPA: hypothetical protein VH988_17935 [Thermoanaerobaculia bacterium]|jgi:hypothetical protein|nr:hypothetical protein [Thermoanaerobaculia bacterium]
MGNQRIHRSSIRNAPSKERQSPFSPRPFAVQAPGEAQRSSRLVQRKGEAAVHGVVQREISKEELNVIGENHDESDARRDREINYAKVIVSADAGYWRENEFALDDQTNFGDPKDLRIADILKRIERHFTPVEKLLEEYADGSKLLNGNQLALVKRSLQVGIESYLTRLVGEISATLKLSKAQKYPLGAQMTKTQFAVWAREGLAHKKKLTERLGEIDQFLESNDGLADFTFELWWDVSEVTRYSGASLSEELKENSTITEERSMAMNDAAEAGAAQLGIWKIGQEHVGDIKAITEPETRSYNLVEKGEFDYILDNPTPTEASKLGLYD